MKPMLRTVLAVILAGLLSSAAQAGDGMERTLLLLETLDCTIAATRPQMTPGETQEALAAKASEVLASKCAGRLNAYARAVEKDICIEHGWASLKSWIVEDFRKETRAEVAAEAARMMTGKAEE